MGSCVSTNSPQQRWSQHPIAPPSQRRIFPISSSQQQASDLHLESNEQPSRISVQNSAMGNYVAGESTTPGQGEEEHQHQDTPPANNDDEDGPSHLRLDLPHIHIPNSSPSNHFPSSLESFSDALWSSSPSHNRNRNAPSRDSEPLTTFVSVLMHQLNRQPTSLSHDSDSLFPILKEKSYTILLYFRNDMQMACILDILWRLQGPLKNRNIHLESPLSSMGGGYHDFSGGSTTIGSFSQHSPARFLILAHNFRSLLLNVQDLDSLLNFYRYFFHLLEHAPKLVSSLDLKGMRILNRMLISDIEPTTQFILSCFTKHLTVPNEVLFDKDMNEEVKHLEQQLKLDYDLTMSDFFSIPLVSHIGSTQTPESSGLDAFPSVSSQKCIIITMEITQDLFLVNFHQIQRITKQFRGEFVYIEPQEKETEKLKVLFMWVPNDDAKIDIDNLLEDNEFVSSSSSTNDHVAAAVNASDDPLASMKIAYEHALRAAAQFTFLNEISTGGVVLFVTTTELRRGFMFGISQKARMLAVEANTQLEAVLTHSYYNLDNSSDTLSYQRTLLFVDTETLSHTTHFLHPHPSATFDIPLKHKSSQLTLHQISYSAPLLEWGIPLVYFDICASKLSFLHHQVEVLSKNREFQTILLVGTESPLNERAYLQHAIQNHCIQHFSQAIHVMRCFGEHRNMEKPFFAVRSLLRELLRMSQPSTSNSEKEMSFPYQDSLEFMLDNLIVDSSKTPFLPVLNAPFGVNFPPNPCTQFLYGHELKQIQDQLWQEIIVDCLDVLNDPIALLVDQFEYFDSESKQVISFLYEHLTQKPALVSITVSSTRHWPVAADFVLETGKLSTRSQFEKFLEVSLQDQLLGMDEQYVNFLVKRTSLNVNFAMELTQFLLHHKQVELDDNGILLYDPVLELAPAMRFNTYFDFILAKLKNMDMNLQTIICSLAIFETVFSFQMVLFVLRDMYQNNSTFLWSSMMKLSVRAVEGTPNHFTFFFLDQNNMFHWLSAEHRDAAASLLSAPRENKLKRKAAEFWIRYHSSVDELVLGVHIFLHTDFHSSSEQKEMWVAVDHALDDLERQLRFFEAYHLLKRKIHVCRQYKRMYSSMEIAELYLRLTQFLRQLSDDAHDGQFIGAVEELKEGLSFSNLKQQHVFLFQLWYLYEKLNDVHTANSYATRLYDLQESLRKVDTQQYQEIALIFTTLSKCTTCFRAEQYRSITDNLIEPCLMAYGKHADALHLREAKKYGFVDAILIILCFGSASSWMLSNMEQAKKYFRMAEQLLPRVVGQRCKREIVALHLLPTCVLLQKRQQIPSLVNYLREGERTHNVAASNSFQKNSLSDSSPDHLHTILIPDLYSKYLEIVNHHQSEEVSDSQSQDGEALPILIDEFLLTAVRVEGAVYSAVIFMMHVHVLILGQMYREARLLLEEISTDLMQPAATPRGVNATPRGERKNPRKLTPLQAIFEYYHSQCSEDTEEEESVLRKLLTLDYSVVPFTYQVKAAQVLFVAEAEFLEEERRRIAELEELNEPELLSMSNSAVKQIQGDIQDIVAKLCTFSK